MKAKNYRQGDVLLLGVNKPKTKGWQKKMRLRRDGVIIEGEVTGHFHKVENGKLYEDPKNKDKMILEAETGCVVVHPEHGPIKMPKGIYEIDIQREYDGKDARKVKD